MLTESQPDSLRGLFAATSCRCRSQADAHPLEHNRWFRVRGKLTSSSRERLMSFLGGKLTFTAVASMCVVSISHLAYSAPHTEENADGASRQCRR